jgi:hypothetical protein
MPEKTSFENEIDTDQSKGQPERDQGRG